MKEFLKIQGLRKTYGATVALNNVRFGVAKGAVHAIIGENGAGKSTLIKILSGMVERDEGTINLDSRPYSADGILDARQRGVSTAFQELSLIPNLTIAENLSLPKLKRTALGFVSKEKNNQYAEQLLEKFMLAHLSPKMKIGELSLAEKQKIEIVRAISHQPKLLLLDEPTAALPDPEWLFNIIHLLKNTEMTIFYISHRLGEIRELCQTGTILRNGTSIDTVQLQGVSDKEIFKMMVGRESSFQISSNQSFRSNETYLEANHLCGNQIHNVHFNMQRGEIIGVAGLEGQGQAELFKVLAGVQQPRSGLIKVTGKALKLKNPLKALRLGITFVAEERKSEGIFPGLSTLANITASSLKKVSKLGLIFDSTEFPPSVEFQEKVKLDSRYLDKKIESLSGGNQQKAIMARALMSNAVCQLLYDPTRGVDVGTKEAFYELIQSFAKGNGCVLWYSTDLTELIGVCDRFLVFYKGEIVLNMGKQDISTEILISATMGHYGLIPAEEAAK